MIGALALLAAALLTWSATHRAGLDLRAGERIGLACGLAPALLGWAVYLPSLALGLGLLTVLLGGAALAAAAAASGRADEARRDVVALASGLRTRGGAAALGSLVLCLALAAPVFREVWFEGPEGALFTGTANNLGDVVLHVGIAHAFAFGENVPPENVIWAGEPLVYPFLPDFSAAALLVSGWETGPALFVPSIGVAAGLFVLLGALARRASGRLIAGLLPGPLLLLSGGAQFALALAAGAWPDPAELEARRIVWKNPLLSLLVTQRATLFGLALIASVALLVWRALDADDAGEPRRAFRGLLGAGWISGALPLVFPHGFMALAAVLPTIALLHRRRLWPAWGALGMAAGVLSLPQVLWILRGGAAGAIRWLPGWMAAAPGESATVGGFAGFWAWNLGLTLPLAAAALLARRFSGLPRAGFWWAWWLWFALPCLVAFAPWAWDNTKLFAVWLAMSLVPVSALLARLLEAGWRGRTAAALALACLTLSGARDVGHALLFEDDYLEYDAEARDAALRLRSATLPGAVVLERPHWAQLAQLAGRRSFIGYPGHLWSHGIDYRPREVEVEAFYRSLAPGGAGSDAERRAFLTRAGIDVVVVGPRERSAYGSAPEPLRSALSPLFRLGPYSAFAVRQD